MVKGFQTPGKSPQQQQQPAPNRFARQQKPPKRRPWLKPLIFAILILLAYVAYTAAMISTDADALNAQLQTDLHQQVTIATLSQDLARLGIHAEDETPASYYGKGPSRSIGIMHAWLWVRASNNDGGKFGRYHMNVGYAPF